MEKSTKKLPDSGGGVPSPKNQSGGTVVPLFDRVLLKPEVEQQSVAGIYIPRDTTDRSLTMTVVAVGDVQAVKVGDRVIVAKYAGTEVTVGTDKFYLVCESDILGRVVL